MDLVCLLETRVKVDKTQEIRNQRLHGWEFLHNCAYAYNGRTWMLWKDFVHVQLIEATDQSITSYEEFNSKKFI